MHKLYKFSSIIETNRSNFGSVPIIMEATYVINEQIFKNNSVAHERGPSYSHWMIRAAFVLTLCHETLYNDLLVAFSPMAHCQNKCSEWFSTHTSLTGYSAHSYVYALCLYGSIHDRLNFTSGEHHRVYFSCIVKNKWLYMLNKRKHLYEI